MRTVLHVVADARSSRSRSGFAGTRRGTSTRARRIFLVPSSDVPLEMLRDLESRERDAEARDKFFSIFSPLLLRTAKRFDKIAMSLSKVEDSDRGVRACG